MRSWTFSDLKFLRISQPTFFEKNEVALSATKKPRILHFPAPTVRRVCGSLRAHGLLDTRNLWIESPKTIINPKGNDDWSPLFKR